MKYHTVALIDNGRMLVLPPQLHVASCKEASLVSVFHLFFSCSSTSEPWCLQVVYQLERGTIGREFSV